MHPTQHSTIPRKRGMTQPKPGYVICTDDDILNAITQLATQQSTRFVLIANLRVSLGLDVHDLDWLRAAITRMDEAGLVMLSPIEKPQQMAAYQAMWFVRNASGIPCHEITSLQQRESGAPMTAGEFIRAASDGLQLLWLSQPRHAPLLKRAAEQSRSFRVIPAPMPAA